LLTYRYLQAPTDSPRRIWHRIKGLPSPDNKAIQGIRKAYTVAMADEDGSATSIIIVSDFV
jgi:hypothetical protein